MESSLSTGVLEALERNRYNIDAEAYETIKAFVDWHNQQTARCEALVAENDRLKTFVRDVQAMVP